MCVRLFKREDGTVLTRDCPVGAKTRRRRRAAVAAVGGGLMAAATALGVSSQRVTMGAAPREGTTGIPYVMGSVMEVKGDIAPPVTPNADPPGNHWAMGVAPIQPTPPKPAKTPPAGTPLMGRR